MPKRYILKVELEFECPATVPPQEAFYRYWSANRKVENDNCKVLDTKIITTAAKVDSAARAHNERRRVLQTMIDQCGFQAKIVKGYRSRYDKTKSMFQLSCQEVNAYQRLPWASVKGSAIFFDNDKKAYNLADPNIHLEIAKELRCQWELCDHKNKSTHV